GKVSKAELEERFYPLDSTADAAYLYKYRRTYFEYMQDEGGFKVITDYHMRIKIYSKDGFEKATQYFEYYKPDSGNKERISSLKAYTFYLENGKVKKKKISKDAIFDEKRSKYRSVKKITMPNVIEGCILEIKYSLISPYGSIDDLRFQYDIPVKKLDYKIEVPEYYTFNKRFKGYYFITPNKSEINSKITLRFKNRDRRVGALVTTGYSKETVDYKNKIEKYIANNIPALKDNEPFVSSIHNYRGGVKYELTATRFPNTAPKVFSSTWKDIVKRVYNSPNFGSELNKTSYFKDDLTKVLNGTTNDNEKIMAIFNHVKSKVKWNDYKGKYTDKGVKKAYKEGVGNVADINLMLTSMLRVANLNAKPVLVSTRANGVPLFPTLDGFNYVIAMVEFTDGSYVLLDATEKYSSPNILPVRVLNWNGRKVEKDGTSSWVKLTSSKHALEDNYLSVKISDEGLVEGVLRSIYSNLKALNYRKNKNHLKEDILREQLEEKHTIEIDEFKLLNKNKLLKTVVERIKFSSEDLVEEINGKLYIEPLLFFVNSTNPFKLEDRKFPVDFATPWKDVHRVSIQIPEGYKIEILPKNIAIRMLEDLGVFKFQTSQIGNKVNTVCILQFNSAIIAPKYYAVLKGFYAKVVEKQSEKIVLVKI
ncbi:transglutaminase domain-containing protein, partial [uncultured Polaribacter sp.]|uniref:transglutaminase domain-containing protein n=1 Tax=uncultured Polaribacter sp. TaxID=174711 RepID=UPI0030DA1FB6